MPNYQLRITLSSYDIINDYLTISEKYMIFKHKPIENEENEHYHIYLFNCPITDADTIRQKFRTHHIPKTKFSVGITAGKRKEKITEYVAYQYGMAPKSQPKLLDHKGISEEEFRQWEMRKDMFYDMINKSKSKSITQQLANADIVVIKEIAVRPDRIWERLVAQEDKYACKTVKQIKSMICAEWLNAGKAMPRPSDLHRYANSLYMRQLYKNGEVPDEACEQLF